MLKVLQVRQFLSENLAKKNIYKDLFLYRGQDPQFKEGYLPKWKGQLLLVIVTS